MDGSLFGSAAVHHWHRSDGRWLTRREWRLLHAAAPDRVCRLRAAHRFTSPIPAKIRSQLIASAGMIEPVKAARLEDIAAQYEAEGDEAYNPDEARLLHSFVLLRSWRVRARRAAVLVALLPLRPPRAGGGLLVSSEELTAALLAAHRGGFATEALSGWLAAGFTDIAELRLLAAGTPEAWVRAARPARLP